MGAAGQKNKSRLCSFCRFQFHRNVPRPENKQNQLAPKLHSLTQLLVLHQIQLWKNIAKTFANDINNAGRKKKKATA